MSSPTNPAPRSCAELGVCQSRADCPHCPSFALPAASTYGCRILRTYPVPPPPTREVPLAHDVFYATPRRRAGRGWARLRNGWSLAATVLVVAFAAGYAWSAWL